MNKRWKFIVIGLILIAGMIGVGGKVYLDKKEAAKEAEIIEAERMSVEALINRYAEIKSVEFEKSGYDKVTGSYGMFIKMTNEKDEFVSFRYSFWKESGELGLNVLKDENIQVRGVTTNKVHVIYSNKEEGEV